MATVNPLATVEPGSPSPGEKDDGAKSPRSGRGSATKYEAGEAKSGDAELEGTCREKSDARIMRQFTLQQHSIKPNRPKRANKPKNRALWLFSKKSKLRIVMARISVSPIFTTGVLVVIMVNCVFLAIDDGTSKPGSALYSTIQTAEYVFTALFTAEFLVKIIAQGFILNGKHSYLRDPWNILDFAVVALSYISLMGSGGNVGAIRTFRLLRPLRAVKNVSGMRVIISSLLTSLPALLNVLVLFLFFMFVFGILGLQMFGDKLRARCVSSTDISDVMDIAEGLCPSRSCPSGYECKLNFADNPHFGLVGFDNIGLAWLTILQIIFLEGWTELLYWQMDTSGGIAIIYFLFCVLVGAIFLVNLITAVIFIRFDLAKREEELNRKKKRQQIEAATEGGTGTKSKDKEHKLAMRYVPGDNLIDRQALRARKAVLNPPDHHIVHKNTVEEFLGDDTDDDGDSNHGNSSRNSIVAMKVAPPPPPPPPPPTSPPDSSKPALPVLGSDSDSESDSLSVAGDESATLRGGGKREVRTSNPLAPRKQVTNFKAKNGLAARAGGAGVESVGSVGRSPPSLERMDTFRERHFTNRKTFKAHQKKISSIYQTVGKGEVDYVNLHGVDPASPTHSLRAPMKLEVVVDKDTEDADIKEGQDGEETGGNTEEDRERRERARLAKEEKKGNWFLYGKTMNVREMNCFLRYVALPSFRIQRNKHFSGFVILCIVLNSVTMAADHEGITPGFEAVLNGLNLFFSSVFLLEMVLKLLGLNPKGYASDRFNIFDGTVVLLWVVETSASGSSALSALRAFRLLRIFKLLRSWTSLRMLLMMVMSSASDLLYFLLILLLFLFSFAVLGMQLFPKIAAPPGMRTDFSNFGMSMLTVFTIFTGENWNEFQYEGVKVYGMSSSFFFISIYVLGNYIFVSTFLAILLSNFDTDEVAKEKKIKKKAKVFREDFLEKRKQERDSRQQYRQLMRDDSPPNNAATAFAEDEGSSVRRSSIRPSMQNHVNTKKLSAQDGCCVHGVCGRCWDSCMAAFDRFHFLFCCCVDRKALASRVIVLRKAGMKQIKPDFFSRHSSMKNLKTEEALKARPMHFVVTTKQVKTLTIYGNALGCIGVGSTFRYKVAKLVNHWVFELSVVLLIIISGVALALDTPGLDPNSELGLALMYIDWVTTVLFTLEVILKLVVHGVIMQKEAYLRNGWNVLDFVIVLLSILNLIVASSGSSAQLGIFKGFRALRALRPLRLVVRFSELQLVMNSIFASLPALVNVLLVSMFFFLIFAIMGVQFFKGRLSRCELDGDVLLLTIEECAKVAGTRWKNPIINFDNFGSAFVALFQVASFEMWPNIMALCLDSTERGLPPVPLNSPAASAYFVLFILIGSYFCFSLFVGVVVDQYNQKHEKFTGSHNLTWVQMQYLEAYKEMVHSPPTLELRPPSRLMFCQCDFFARRALFKLVTNPKFDAVIMALIMINVVAMSLNYSSQPASYEQALEMTNIVLSWCFFTEMCLKLMGLGSKQYFKDSWNRFDFLIVMVSLVTFVLSFFPASELAVDPSLLRSLRILRIFRLVKRAKGLNQLVATLVYSLPSLGNVGLLLLLLYFMYATAAMNLFGSVAYGEFLDRNTNFSSFGMAMLTLFRMTTGESWNGIMSDCMVEEPTNGCSEEAGTCGNPNVAIVFFISFSLLSTSLMLNVFVAVVLKNFETEMAKDTALPHILSQDAIGDFGAVWARHSFSYMVSVWNLPDMLKDLKAPLGPKKNKLTRIEFLWMLESLQIPQVNGKIHYLDVIHQMARPLFRTTDDDAGGGIAAIPKSNELLKAILRTRSVKFPELNGKRNFQFSAADCFAAITIQRKWRSYLRRTKQWRVRFGVVEFDKKAPKGGMMALVVYPPHKQKLLTSRSSRKKSSRRIRTGLSRTNSKLSVDGQTTRESSETSKKRPGYDRQQSMPSLNRVKSTNSNGGTPLAKDAAGPAEHNS